MAWVDYAPRFLGPTYLERDRANPLRLRLYFESTHAVPTSGTFSLYDPANTAVVNATAVVMSDGYATVTVAAATLTAYAFGAGWRVEWSLVMPDTYTHVFRNGASLVRVRLPPAASEADLLRLHPNLRDYLPTGATSWQDQLDVAWEYQVVGYLEANGKRPYLIVSQNAVVPWHAYEALAIIGSILNAGGDDETSWGRFQRRYEDLALKARTSCNFEYDETDSGRAATAGKRTAADSTIWLSSNGADRGTWDGGTW